MAPGRRRAPVKRRRPDLSRALAPALRLTWVVLVLAGVAAIVAGWWGPVGLPRRLPAAGAVTVSTCYAFGMAARAGGRPFVSGALALAVGLAGVLARVPVLTAAAAVGTAVLAAVLGVLATTPAARFRRVVLEVAVSVVTVAFGALAAAAFQPQVSLLRVGYLCLGLSLLTAMGVVYRLGAGFTGLGTRGVVMVLGGLVLLAVTLAYSQALARWGSPEMVEAVRRGTAQLAATIGAEPRPVELLLGFPALAWGVSIRARRRQGWWVCAFGAAGLAAASVSLLGPGRSLSEAGLSLVYSAVAGLLLGYLVIRVDAFLTGTRGRRARRLEAAAAHRPEPGRMHALL
ncbi:MAG TPA: hypothetical protein VFJ09_12045 [Nocardioidaceae bacterium]|nr:hypothetical protein [Nocardioidaceae bacterium]